MRMLEMIQLAELTEGMYRGDYTAPVTLENYYEAYGETERGRTFAVTAEFEFYSPWLMHSHDWVGEDSAYVYLNSHRLPYYGHEDETSPKRILAEYGKFAGEYYEKTEDGKALTFTRSQSASCGLVDVSGGCTDVSTVTDVTADYNPRPIWWSWPYESVDNYTNVGTVTYDEANPFVLLGDNFRSMEEDGTYQGALNKYGYGIQGSLPKSAEKMSYIAPSSDGPSREKDLLVTKSYGTFVNKKVGDGKYTGTTSMVWGYRNLYKEGETVIPKGEEAKALDSEFDSKAELPDRLVISPNGSGYKAELNPPVESEDKVAVLRGNINYVSEGNSGYYAFNNGRAYLSPTVSVNFDAVKDYFHVKPDGSIDYKGIRISVPNYCIYKSKNRPKCKEPEFSYDEKKGLVIGLDPANNDAIISVNIPYTTTNIEGVALDLDGNVNFYGGIHIRTLFDGARFDLTKFQMGTDPKDGTFGMNGIEASLDVEDVGFMGFDVNKAKGVINTIAAEEYYYFDIDINAFDVVEFAGKLEIKYNKKTGVLMPNDLQGQFKSDLVGITVIPEVPAIEINGVKVGFAGLVDTINEDYFAIPPLTLTIGGHGSVAKCISGWLTTTLGPSEFTVIGSDLEISPPSVSTNLQLLKELSISFKDVGKEIEYNNRKYKGIDLSGTLSAKINLMNDGKKIDVGLFNVDVAHILDIYGSVGFSAFGGRNEANTMAYLDVNATGNARASLKVPASVFLFGGREIASSNLLMKVGAQTEIPYRGSLENCLGDAVKNINGYVACCLDNIIDLDVLGKYYLRTAYVSPDSFTMDVGSGDPGEFVVNSSGAKGSSVVQKLPVLDKDSKQTGEIMFGLALKEKDINVTADTEASEARSASNPIIVSLADGVHLEPGDSVVLQVKPVGSVSEDEFISALKIDGTPALKVELDENGVRTNSGNVIPTVVDGEVISAALFLDNTKEQWVIDSGVQLEEEPTLYISNENLIEKFNDVNYSGNTLNGNAANLKENAEYKLITNLCTDPDSDGFIVGEPLDIAEGNFQVSVPNQGEAAETGDYYISTTLVQIQTEDFNGDGIISEDETIMIPLERWVSEETMHYTNTAAPQTPANVSLTATGNETLTCAFNEVENAEGYRIRILKDGEYTGYGYEMPVVVETDPETGKTIKTLDSKGGSEAVSYEDGAFTVRMAPTVCPEQTAEGIEQPAALEPGSGYSVGISAYSYLDGDTKEYPVYSEEGISDSATISTYEKANFSVKLNGNEAAKNDSGIYEGTVSQESRELTVEVTSGGNYLIEVTAESDEAETLTAEGSALTKELPDLEGSVMYDIVVTNLSTLDKTTAFLQVNKDEIPPLLLMDAESYMSDPEGKTIITGTTDPGVTVNGVKADADGRFELVNINDEKIAVVKEYYATYDKIIREEKTLSSLEDFIHLKEEVDEIDPANWEGPGVYYTITREYVYNGPCSLAYYQELEEGVAKGEVEELSELNYSEKQMSVEEAEKLEEADYRTITFLSTATKGFALDYVVTAEDELGNTTEAIVKISPHIHTTKKVSGKAATCFKAGRKEHYVCTTCGQKFQDKYGTAQAGDVTIPKLKPSLSLGVGKVKVSKTTVPMKVGQSFKKIKATMKKGDKLKSATSGNKKIVTVKLNSAKTKLILKAGKKTGKTKITVKTKAGAKSTFTVKVQKTKVTATKIQGFKKTLTLKKGKTYQMPKAVKPVTVTDKITFKSSKPKIVSVTKGGKLKALKKGKAVITVTIGKKKFKCTVTVK